MKKMFLVVLLIVGLLIPAVSANENEIVYDEDLSEYVDTSSTGIQHYTNRLTTYDGYLDEISFSDIRQAQTIFYLVFEVPGDNGNWKNGSKLADGSNPFTYDFNGKERPGVVNVTRKTNILGQVTSTVFTVFLNDWDIGNLAGKQEVKCPFYFYKGTVDVGTRTKETNVYLSGDGHLRNPIKITEVTAIAWKHHITIAQDLISHFITVNGFIDGDEYNAEVEFLKDDEIFSSFATAGKELSFTYPKWQIDLVKIISPSGKVYSYPLEGEGPVGPDAIPINIRVQNSQTGALLADAHVKINASVNGTFHEVVNETIPAGTKTYYLQPTGGGLPNPDFYRLVATVEGYNPIMPYIDFEADIATTIYAYLNPIGGAPVDENKTFIDFYVRDLNANPVAGATVKFGAYTLLTNSAGYTIFEVEKDKNYVWTVSKLGYGSVTGNAVIGSNDRYTINAVIAPAVTPTLTTPIPTTTPVKPTPSLTAPTGESVSNLLEWFAAHFGMILGGGVEIGKIFMWLCFTIPAGVYVGNKAKAGAAGFMAGAGIVTLFFVIIGWVPVWLVVILALIIGLLYAKAFSNIGNGGGR